jgi:hypothetical protein
MNKGETTNKGKAIVTRKMSAYRKDNSIEKRTRDEGLRDG